MAVPVLALFGENKPILLSFVKFKSLKIYA